MDANKGAKVVSLLIPDRCLPEGSGELVVSAILLDKRGDNPLLAEDRLTVRSLVELQPDR